MIIFDDFLPDSELRQKLMADDFWDGYDNGFCIEWFKKGSEVKNIIHELCRIVWTDVFPAQESIDGWEYWGHHLIANGKNEDLDFHYDTDLNYQVSPDEEKMMFEQGKIKAATTGLVYYAHQSMPKGGYLEIKRDNNELERIEPVPNRLIVFNPSKQHRVTKVTDGVRRSIVSNLWAKKPDRL